MQLGPGPARPLKFHLMSRELILLLDITQTHMHAHTCSEFIRNVLTAPRALFRKINACFSFQGPAFYVMYSNTEYRGRVLLF